MQNNGKVLWYGTVDLNRALIFRTESMNYDEFWEQNQKQFHDHPDLHFEVDEIEVYE